MENIKTIQIYDKIKHILSNNNFSVSDSESIDFGIQFIISKFNWSGVIRIYENKKGVIKIDYSQLKDNEKLVTIRNLVEGTNLNIRPNENLFPVIGTDESGKGDFFGPLVSAGVYVDIKSAEKLAVIGVRDSKDNSDQINLDLAMRIMDICRGKYAIIEISPDKYNDLYGQFKREGKNLNSLLAWGHAKAIEEVLGLVDCKIAIADQFADENFILGKLQEKGRRIKLIQRHKAEQNIAVAAASIIARARFLEKLSNLSKEYKIDLPKGSSSLVAEAAKKFCKIYGQNALRKVAKINFKTYLEVSKDLLNG